MPQKGDPVRGLPEEVVELTFGKGLSEHEDEWLQLEGFTRLHNVFQDKLGAVRKLPGYDALSKGARNVTGEAFPTDNLTGPSKLFARGDQIGVLDNGRLYAKADKWTLQGRASPWVAEQRTVIELSSDTTDVPPELASPRIDCCRSGDWSFSVWEVQSSTDTLKLVATYLPTGQTVALLDFAPLGARNKPRLVPWTNDGEAILFYLNGSLDLRYRRVTPDGVGNEQILEEVDYDFYDVWSDPDGGYCWAFFCEDNDGGEGDATFVVRRYELTPGTLTAGPAETITIYHDVSWPTPPALAIYGNHAENRVVAAWVEHEIEEGDFSVPPAHQSIRAICFQSDPSQTQVWDERVIYDDWDPVEGEIGQAATVNQIGIVSLGSSGHYVVWSDMNAAADVELSPGEFSTDRPVVRGKRVTTAGTVDDNPAECGYVRLRSRPAWDGTRVFFLAEYVHRTAQERPQRHHYILGIEPVISTPPVRRFRPFGHFAYVTAGVETGVVDSANLWANAQRMSTPYQGADGGWRFQAIELWAEGSARYALREYALYDDDRVGVAAELGNQTYIAGALLSAWDGLRVLEAGFLHEPFFEAAVNQAGSLPVGTYRYKLTYARYSASGEVTRSAPSLELVAEVNGLVSVRIATQSYVITNQMEGDKRPVFLEIWRTRANETSPFFLLRRIELDPNERNIVQNPGIDDEASDSALGAEVLYTEGELAELANHPPVPATSVCLWRNRIFLTDGERVLYSKEGVANRGAEFSRLQSVERATRQRLTGVAPLGEVLAVFGADETAFIYGDGPAANGDLSRGGYTGPTVIADPLGCTQPAGLCVLPGGLLVPTRHGIRFLSLGREYTYLGAGLERVLDNFQIVRDARVCRATVDGGVRHLHGDLLWLALANEAGTIGRFAIWDFLHQTWATAFDGSEAGNRPRTLVCVGDDLMWLAEDGQGYVRGASYLRGAAQYAEQIETPWIKPAGPSGEIRARRMWLLAEWAGATYGLRVEVEYDFHADQTYAREFTGAELKDGAGQLVRLRIPFPRQRCQAFRVRLTALPGEGAGSRGFRFVALRLAIARRRTNGRLLPARNAGGPLSKE